MKRQFLPVMEEFYSLQGEGFHAGIAAYFIRLAGCNVYCHWCDTKSSWQSSHHQLVNVEELVERVINNKSKHVVITGGEPFLHDLTAINRLLKEKNIICHVETSGTSPYAGTWDWVSLSPKPWKPPLPEFYKNAHELKVVIQTVEDFIWAEEAAKNVNSNCFLFLQPEWSVFKKILPFIVEYIKENPKWRISIQSHKFMKIP